MPESETTLNDAISEQISSADAAEVADSEFSAETPEFSEPELSDLTYVSSYHLGGNPA
jgi:hypothetical protein